MKEIKTFKIEFGKPEKISAKKQEIRRYSRRKDNAKKKLRNDFIMNLVGLSTFIIIWLAYTIIS